MHVFVREKIKFVDAKYPWKHDKWGYVNLRKVGTVDIPPHKEGFWRLLLSTEGTDTYHTWVELPGGTEIVALGGLHGRLGAELDWTGHYSGGTPVDIVEVLAYIPDGSWVRWRNQSGKVWALYLGKDKYVKVLDKNLTQELCDQEGVPMPDWSKHKCIEG